MSIQLQTTGYPLAVSSDFINMLQQRINHHCIPSNISRITVKLTDPKYEEKPGGFHPTDIQLEKQTDGAWHIVSICDYCNVSHTQYPKFAKDLEFDFRNKRYHNLGRIFSLQEATEHFHLWQTNFVYFVEGCGVYDAEVQMHWTPNIG